MIRLKSQILTNRNATSKAS